MLIGAGRASGSRNRVALDIETSGTLDIVAVAGLGLVTMQLTNARGDQLPSDVIPRAGAVRPRALTAGSLPRCCRLR